MRSAIKDFSQQTSANQQAIQFAHFPDAAAARLLIETREQAAVGESDGLFAIVIICHRHKL
ncbi:MAG: hypothetical protein KME45_10145 [Stenomitos rutilans HA7619-LM2]|nr:hypothetical protein [Stenomitos rutilans HA7619-LM2]